MAAVGILLMLAITVLPIVGIAKFPLPANRKLKYILLSILVSPPVVTSILFYFAKGQPHDTENIIMQFGIASYFGPWLTYTHLKQQRKNAVKQGNSDASS